MAKGKKVNDPVFYDLANNIASILKNNGVSKISKSKFTEIQKYQVERMMELEGLFRKSINSFKQSDRVYMKFVLFIKVEKGNILTARPYFRENAKKFGSHVSPAFKGFADEETEKDSLVKLKKFNINHRLMVFIIENWKGNLPKKAKAAWEEHQVIRHKIIENSMPLAINVAMRFYRAVPRNHDTLMDMISLAMSGLCTGTDKWVGPFRTVFRSVCMSRMKGNIMDSYNQTPIHYYPSDKKIIYKSNLLKNREKIKDISVLLGKINEYLKEAGDKRVLTEDALSDLLNGQTPNSLDVESDEEGYSYHQGFSSSQDIAKDVEHADSVRVMAAACEFLEVKEKKIIKLKGVDL